MASDTTGSHRSFFVLTHGWMPCQCTKNGDSAGGRVLGVETGVSAQDLVRWSEALSGIARTGLGFTQNLYERERFEEVLKVAADMRVAAGHELESEVLLEEWMKTIGSGVPG